MNEILSNQWAIAIIGGIIGATVGNILSEIILGRATLPFLRPISVVRQPSFPKLQSLLTDPFVHLIITIIGAIVGGVFALVLFSGSVYFLTAIAGVAFAIVITALSPNILWHIRRVVPSERRKGGRPPKRKPLVYWLIFWISVGFIVLIAPIAAITETGTRQPDEPDPSFSIAITPNAELDEEALDVIPLDTYENSNDNYVGPISSNIRLQEGKNYVVKVSGTWSAWAASWWTSVCTGTPEPWPQTPSPDTFNGPVGIDAAFIFARPERSEYCGQEESLPEPSFAVYSLLISLDNGETWSPLRPDDLEYRIDHTYTYSIKGSGRRAMFLLRSGIHNDDYGVLTIQILEKA